MKVFVVMPAYNERGRIGAVVRRLFPRVDRVIVVDDGSADSTADEARAAGADVVSHVLNRGQGAALKTGTVLAVAEGADVVVHFDADGQHDPETIPTLTAPIVAGGADFVSGSRFLGVTSDGMPLSRKLLLAAARQFSSLVLGIPRTVTDPQSGLRAMTVEAACAIDFTQDRMAHCSEILRIVSRSELRSVEVPVRVLYTAETLAKGQKATDAFKIVWQLLLGAFQR